MNLLASCASNYNTAECLKYLRTIPRTSPAQKLEEKWLFHCYWYGEFGPKPCLSIKSFLATQDLEQTELILWLDKHHGYSGYESNPYLKPLLSKISVRSYDPQEATNRTPLAGSPALADTEIPNGEPDVQTAVLPNSGVRWGAEEQDTMARLEALSLEQTKKALRADVFRIVTLHKHGGCYFDLDMFFLRDFFHLRNMLPQPEFCYQWSDLNYANSAILSLMKRGNISSYLIRKAARFNSCHPEKLFRKGDTRLNLLMLPSPFFDPLWLLNEGRDSSKLCPLEKMFENFFRPYTAEELAEKLEQMQEYRDSCFTYHWHNQWTKLEARNSVAGCWNQAIDKVLLEKYGLRATETFSETFSPDVIFDAVEAQSDFP